MGGWHKTCSVIDVKSSCTVYMHHSLNPVHVMSSWPRKLTVGYIRLLLHPQSLNTFSCVKSLPRAYRVSCCRQGLKNKTKKNEKKRRAKKEKEIKRRTDSVLALEKEPLGYEPSRNIPISCRVLHVQVVRRQKKERDRKNRIKKKTKKKQLHSDFSTANPICQGESKCD